SGVLVLQSNTAGVDAVLEILETLVPEAFEKIFGQKCEALIIKADSSIRRLEGLQDFSRIVFGEAEKISKVSFLEGEVRYAADFLEGQKTGYFLDQRDNRQFFRQVVS